MAKKEAKAISRIQSASETLDLSQATTGKYSQEEANEWVSAPCNRAFRKSAPCNRAPPKFAPCNRASHKSAPCNCAFCKFAP
jgi:hypothetical protein